MGFFFCHSFFPMLRAKNTKHIKYAKTRPQNTQKGKKNAAIMAALLFIDQRQA
jgi:hypothetical protein